MFNQSEVNELVRRAKSPRFRRRHIEFYDDKIYRTLRTQNYVES